MTANSATPSMSTNKIPTTGNRTTLAPSLESFLKDNPSLHLGGDVDFHSERRHHLEVFGWHSLPKEKRAPIGKVEFTAVREPHGTIPIRIFYPKSVVEGKKTGAAALIYFHGGGYTVGSVDEFENGLRILAEEADVVTIGVDYRLAPEHSFPTQLDEYSTLIDYFQTPSNSKPRGISPVLIFGAGDSVGGNMTAAISLRRLDNKLPPLAGQLLLYPEARLPFDTPAATENNSGYYLECNGIFSFADHYLPRPPTISSSESVAPGHRYVSPGMQPVSKLGGQPQTAVFTCGFDPLRDVGVEYASKLQEAGNDVEWKHFPELTHGFLQMAPWSEEATHATKQVAKSLRRMAYES